MSRMANTGLSLLLLLPFLSRPTAAGTNDAKLAAELQRRYDRTASRVMVRTLDRTGRAALDHAAYDRNCVFHYPLKQALTPPARKPPLDGLHFSGAFEKGTVVDAIAETTLTGEDRARPLAWRPLLNYLCEWNYDATEKLLDVTAQVSSPNWGNTDVVRPLQEIAAAFLHADRIWVRVDFRPELSWLPCTDTDRDGYPELFARIDPGRYDVSVLKAVRTGYMDEMLTRKEMEQALYETASEWYPSLMTVVLEPKQSRPWPGEKTEPGVRALFGDRRFSAPFAVLRSKPYGRMLYNVFLLPNTPETTQESSLPAAAPVATSTGATAPVDTAAVRDSIAAELSRWGGGDWNAWVARLGELHTAVGRMLDSRPKELNGLVARDGFLFYRGDVEYLLSGDLRKQPNGRDPFPAIVDFAGQLRSRGIECLLAVIPSKAEVYPDRLAPEAPVGATPYVAPYGRKLLAELAEAGVCCVDLLPSFIEHRYDDEGLLYMPQDTHWTPRGVELAAALIARQVRQCDWYESTEGERITYRVRRVACKRLGDTCGMLTDRERIGCRPMELTARQVVDPDGRLYTDSADSPVVMLGDSFTGVFHFEDCRHAGLSAHLARELGMPVDLIMAHGSGPRIRARLARRGGEALATKRVVVWTVAARDLYDYWAPWARIMLPSSRTGADAEAAVLVGTVTLVSTVPDPRRVAYKECLTFITYRIETVEGGSLPDKKLLAVFWGMRDRKLQPAARFRPGQRHRLTVRPFADMPKLARVMQADDTEEFELTPYWVIRHESPQ